MDEGREKSVKKSHGIWLPDHDTWLPDHFKGGHREHGLGTYQFYLLKETVGFCTKFRTAVDVGGHVGLWSMWLAGMFDRVEAFEPFEPHADCFKRNVHQKNVSLNQFALGDVEKRWSLETRDGNSCITYLTTDGHKSTKTVRLDDLGLESVDLMKIDVEGFEEPVARGAMRTIERDRPVICAEYWPRLEKVRFGLPERGAIFFLESLGYRIARHYDESNVIMVHEGK